MNNKKIFISNFVDKSKSVKKDKLRKQSSITNYQLQLIHHRDLLRVPVLGRLLRGRWGRLFGQGPLLAVAALMVYDGFTGPPLAPYNIATVLAWVHYRGLVILALVLVGNLFCMSCPFTLPRTLARRFGRRGRRWPRPLRNKWPAVAVLFLFFWLYEWLDLWASPWLTAWIVVAYFVAAGALEALFAESPFCKYLCPLGSFNFVAATVSPFQITARQTDVCRICPGKECVNGSAAVSGCGTELFVPLMATNLDCTFCLDCARACPYDNVALAARSPLRELLTDAWPRRWDLSFLMLVFAFLGLSNAFGMTPPIYILLEGLATRFPWAGEALLLLAVFAFLDLFLPALAGLTAAGLSRRLAGRREPLRVSLARFVPAVMPLAVAIWLAHYLFHFATAALAVIPLAQQFLLDHGLTLLGLQPAWRLGPILPMAWLMPIELAIVLIGLLGSLYVLDERNRRHFGEGATRVMMPWAALFVLMAAAAIVIFTLPMEMRGSALGGH